MANSLFLSSRDVSCQISAFPDKNVLRSRFWRARYPTLGYFRPQKPVKNGSNREILRNLLNFEKLTVRSVNTSKKRSEAARNGMAATTFFSRAIPGVFTSQFVARKANGHLL